MFNRVFKRLCDLVLIVPMFSSNRSATYSSAELLNYQLLQLIKH